VKEREGREVKGGEGKGGEGRGSEGGCKGFRTRKP